jgi:5-(carboxyamino)imidazole ribonucleotide mutase
LRAGLFVILAAPRRAVDQESVNSSNLLASPKSTPIIRASFLQILAQQQPPQATARSNHSKQPLETTMAAVVAIIMGSQSDWETMSHAAATLRDLGVSYDDRIVSAHRTPERLYNFAKGAKGAGYKVIIAGAGGAAHLPGMTASLTELPVFGVPIESKAMSGVDSLYSIVQMPAGVPVGTLAIGKAGAINAALLAASVLALNDAALAGRLAAWRKTQTDAVAERPASGGERA